MVNRSHDSAQMCTASGQARQHTARQPRLAAGQQVPNTCHILTDVTLLRQQCTAGQPPLQQLLRVLLNLRTAST